MKCHNKFHARSGIAIGPILFVIAILAVLAAAVAAGSGTLTGGTNQENAKVMAQLLINYTANIDNAFQKIKLEGNYADAQVSFEIPSSTLTIAADGTDYQSFTVNANCHADTCKVFMPSGGSLTPTAIPLSAFSSLSDLQQLAGGAQYCTTSNSEECRYFLFGTLVTPIAIAGINTITSLRQGVWFYYINKNVCIQINNLVGVLNPVGVPPVYGTNLTILSGSSPAEWDQTNYQTYWSFLGTIITGNKDFCFYDGQSYNYIHEFF